MCYGDRINKFASVNNSNVIYKYAKKFEKE